ncbi:MAG TPA: TRL-like family protein [Nitrospira sp.]|jgi:hypothetical protein|nr:TRL-like family protein [Nitrospira sp.]
MRHSLVLAVIGVGLLSLTGCQPVASPLYGWMYNETQFGDFATTSADTTKEGKACAHTILGAWATGDASIDAAKADGKITVVSSVDHSAKHILGIFGTWCTIVKGK